MDFSRSDGRFWSTRQSRLVRFQVFSCQFQSEYTPAPFPCTSTVPTPLLSLWLPSHSQSDLLAISQEIDSHLPGLSLLTSSQDHRLCRIAWSCTRQSPWSCYYPRTMPCSLKDYQPWKLSRWALSWSAHCSCHFTDIPMGFRSCRRSRCSALQCCWLPSLSCWGSCWHSGTRLRGTWGPSKAWLFPSWFGRFPCRSCSWPRSSPRTNWCFAGFPRSNTPWLDRKSFLPRGSCWR